MYSLPSFADVGNGDRLALDSDAPLALDVHVVEDLVVEIPVGDQPRALNEAIRQRGLAMVNMSNDAEISVCVEFPMAITTRAVYRMSSLSSTERAPAKRGPGRFVSA